jgi:hypothetical protein
MANDGAHLNEVRLLVKRRPKPTPRQADHLVLQRRGDCRGSGSGSGSSYRADHVAEAARLRAGGTAKRGRGRGGTASRQCVCIDDGTLLQRLRRRGWRGGTSASSGRRSSSVDSSRQSSSTGCRLSFSSRKDCAACDALAAAAIVCHVV